MESANSTLEQWISGGRVRRKMKFSDDVAAFIVLIFPLSHSHSDTRRRQDAVNYLYIVGAGAAHSSNFLIHAIYSLFIYEIYL